MKKAFERIFRIIKRQVTVVYVVLLLIILAYIVGDRTIWGAWTSMAPPLVWVLLLLPRTIRLRSWPVAVALIALLVVTTEWPRLGRATPRDDDTVRLVSWNIGSGNLNWLEAIGEYEPDIVLVQEGINPGELQNDFNWYSTPDPGVLTRFPVEILPTRKVGPWTEPQLLVVEIRERRLLIANVRLMLPSVVIQLVDRFGERPFQNYRARISQYENLAELVKESAARAEVDSIILVGDFNTPARMPSLAPLSEFLRDG